ncbi:MAG: ABC transporter permease [Sedimentisphaerales bacterium]|nr:ABC transporter permease [Sedimentisphaerales bacterium]
MRKFLTIVGKDVRLLLRDPVGLAMIFAMPAVLLLIFTLVQDGAFRKVSRFSASLCIVNEDDGKLASKIVEGLSEVEGLTLASSPSGSKLDRAGALALLEGDKAQACLVIPAGFSSLAELRARHWARPDDTNDPGPAAEIGLYVDPSLPSLYRDILALSMERLALRAELALALNIWSGTLVETLADGLDPKFADELLAEPEKVMPPELTIGSFLRVPDAVAGEALVSKGNSTLKDSDPYREILPNMVQQNVPGYTLFAMLFIVIPASNALLRERREGTLLRLRTMPVHPLLLVAGRLVTFLSVSVLQFLIMLAAGCWVLPLLGGTAFTFSAQWPPLIALTLCAGFMAVGLALAIASTARSADQAGVVGSTSAVVLGAVGGVFVPVQIMPPVMRHLSGYTPVNWAMTAYQDLFLHDSTLADIWGRMALLFVFGAAGLLWAWVRLFPRR